jgi:hypothetical protein
MNYKKGWSFCIITGPNNELILEQCVEKILLEFMHQENFEIIVIGNPKDIKINLSEKVKIIPFNEEFFSLSFSNIIRAVKEMSLKRLFFRTGAICHKKNLAAKIACFDKLCIMHDYVGLDIGWREGYEIFHESWDVAMNKIYDINNNRHRDWLIWDDPRLGGACLLPYEGYSNYMYIPGTYFCVKKEFFLNNLLNEKLFWGEAEDVEWSKRIREKTVFKMNIHSSVKYLKQKPKNDCPNCPSWEERNKKAQDMYGRK